MIAKLILTALLCGVLVYAWAQYKRAPAVALVSVLAALGGLYFVWEPQHATLIATHVGIGRGVDLVLYIWVIISLVVLLNLHLKLRAQMDVITQLARAVALANAGRER